ncbi:Dimeric alpha-beta barrel [Penicillium angulare]|uniref:Dimeric alpha-beta barrel n=1 Tax=Penicillium angulare TaxID=116970 RepID=UPI0025417485|nr:Dimeric alpha-beta barrel [Penicillium angulare]KAJ5281453.1 Dimeric alpha-beta barrel [Penicillium angulare]
MTELQESQPVKLTITHYRKPEHTHEAFIKWITDEHVPLAIPIFQKHGVIEYTLFVTPPPLNDSMRESLAEYQPNWQIADFDCFIEYQFPSMDAIGAFMTDPEWAEVLKDQVDWVDIPKALVSFGHSTSYILNGRPVNVPK